ncbi:rod shape-determining protein MreC [Patescibacteria group bacterium]|nr:MAG: rod shape-determining protein MreC [Patescibacteria group bacterium]
MPKQSRKKVILLAGFFVIYLTAHYLGLTGAMERAARGALIPFAAAAYGWSNNLVSKYNFFSSREKLSVELNQCLADRAKRESAEARLKNLEMENAELKKLAAFKSKKGQGMLATNVIGKNTDNIEKMVIIDAGEKEGVVVGQAVVAGDGLFVGVVARAKPDISFVRLINDNQSKIAATALNKDKSIGVVEGGFGLSVRMNFIPRGEELLVGDFVITSGLDKAIPRGLLIGQVAVSENEAYQPFQQAVLITAADLEKLSIVGVLKY